MTPADEALFIQLWQQGRDTAEIGQQLGIPRGTVASRAKRLADQGKIQTRPRGGAYHKPARQGTTGWLTRTARGRAEGHPAMDRAAVEGPDRAPERRGV